MKLISILISFFILCSAQAQIDIYPLVSKDTLGNDIVIMTIQQANKLDNLSSFGIEMKLLYDNLTEVDSLCQELQSEKDSLIVYLNEFIITKDSIVEIQNNQLSNLNNQISNFIRQDSLYRLEISNKDEEIILKDEKINDLKFKGLLSGSMNIIVLILILL